ncbi:D-arabinono-1,4-lactone oxidase [Agrobacterium vitis]|uniref:D-arabinono-1,4-lactone oxidase n=1 Tax=Rhizobium/Agrobacterium group TaxID=227290 RepID=UPI0008DBF1FB|nr:MULTISPECIES: D-arabinono-1,4-lactone oxidase [Rhizobium/Agrobacterium group]MCF1432595.1 FAD-binding protein [Allorhizobium ampelinum]MCF1445547.1 FAD-binding protein [Allorhizobium ampelinum]MCF1491461.1 FAD-binding protein [Allorhizobium ampelinum]MUO87869.1 FAD-binding protein [Agrobacterium vitis]MUZ51002.1 FAD-binding protein [Agrobacterium vitis]
MIPGDNLSWSNWSGSVETKLKAILRPRTKEELQDVIRSAPGPLRLVGSGHSFTPLVSTPGTIVDLSALSGLIDHDSDALTATIGAGTKLGSLTELLAGIGQALPNMGDIDKQSVAGALGTATHGSGLGLGAYHTLLKGMQFIDGRGTHREFTAGRDDEMIHATGVTLGSFGALTAVTFQNVPAYNLRRKRTMLSIGNTLENFETLMSAHRSAEIFFVPFANHALFQTLDITDETGDFQVTSEDEDGLATLKKLRTFLRWFPGLRRKLIGNAMAKLSDEEAVGEWMKVYVTDRQTKFNEMEYHLPFEEGAGALAEIIELIEKRFPEIYFPIEVRSVKGDEFWLSPFYKRDTCSIAIHHGIGENPAAFFLAAEAVFRKRGGRPHWGKLHNLRAADLVGIYPRFKDAMEIRSEIDPENRFISPYMATLLGVR